MPSKRRKATLWELLAILAIIATLSLVLFPVFRQVREQSMQVTCANNLKVLGIACEMYQQDWGEVLVPWGAPFAWQPSGKFWPVLLDQYIRQIPNNGQMIGGNLPNVFRCPSAPEDTSVSWASERSYGMNIYCGGWFPGGDRNATVVRLSKVICPEATVRIVDTWWASNNQGTLFAPTPRPPQDTNATIPGRHSGLNNVLWIDGHVSAMTNAEYLLTDSYVDSLGYTGNVWCRLDGPKPVQ